MADVSDSVPLLENWSQRGCDHGASLCEGTDKVLAGTGTGPSERWMQALSFCGMIVSNLSEESRSLMSRAKALPRRHSSQGREPATLRILFVERDVTAADLLVPSLRRKGYQVAVAHNQRQALGQIRSLRPNMLVIDIASFGPKGYAVGDAVRTRLAGVPAVLLLEEGHQAAGGAAEAFMTRPFTSRKLLHRIGVAAEHVAFREIQIGSLVLDLDGRVLSKGGKSWQLRPKEATVLALLMSNAGKVVSRQEIMRQVWETDYVGDTRTLSVHICWLRQKIEDDPRRPTLLRTVRGVGYCLLDSTE